MRFFQFARTPNHALPFRQAQGPELAEGQRTGSAVTAPAADRRHLCRHVGKPGRCYAFVAATSTRMLRLRRLGKAQSRGRSTHRQVPRPLRLSPATAGLGSFGDSARIR